LQGFPPIAALQLRTTQLFKLPIWLSRALESATLALCKSAEELTDYFEICRRKRNQIDYTRTRLVTESEAKEIVIKAKEFCEVVETCIAKNHPKLVK
jgi:uncharacterized protein (UPF0332 family)